MKGSSILPPVFPPDRHIREGETPNRKKYRLVKEISVGGIALYRIEKRLWWTWRCVFPVGMKRVIGGDPDEDRVRQVFDIMTGRIKDNVTIIDEA